MSQGLVYAIVVALIVAAFGGVHEWLVICVYISCLMIPSFLLATRADYRNKAMPPIS